MNADSAIAVSCVFLLAALAVAAAVPWWPWEAGLLALRVSLAACYGACAVAAVAVAAWLARHPDASLTEVTS